MGYFKNEQVANQEDVDRLVGWYRWHRDKLPVDYMQWLLKDDELLWKAIEMWERQPYPPRPASSHVALANRDHIRAERRASSRDRAELWWGLVGFSFLTVLIGAALVYAVGVL